MWLSILGFILILCPLVVAHEFGHYLFARLFGVRADVFSIGFGKRLFGIKLWDTDWRLSLIPLGGYVKLLGENPKDPLPQDQRRFALHYKAPWKRFFIFLGGPLFNLVFAVLIFMCILAVGEPKVASVLGRVEPGSLAEKIGFQEGDRILEIQGKKIKAFYEAMMEIQSHPKEQLDFKISRSSKIKTLHGTLGSEEGYTLYGERKQVGTLSGISPFSQNTKIGISNPKSFAAQKKVQLGDEFLRVNQKKVKTWREVQGAFQKVSLGEKVLFEIEKKNKKKLFLEIKKEKNQTLAQLGFYPIELFVSKVLPHSPAKKAGLLAQSRLMRVSGRKILSFFQLKKWIQKQTQEKGFVVLEWEYQGQIFRKKLYPMTQSYRDPELREKKQFLIGVVPYLGLTAVSKVIEREWRPWVLIEKATMRVVDLTIKNFFVIWKMIQGKVSFKTLGGPILIGKVAGNSIAQGWIVFLMTMALLSVGLGVLNILPIPVLDGGHILLLLIEVVRRKPLSLEQVERFHQVGLSVLLILMLFVLKNDIARIFM